MNTILYINVFELIALYFFHLGDVQYDLAGNEILSFAFMQSETTSSSMIEPQFLLWRQILELHLFQPDSEVPVRISSVFITTLVGVLKLIILYQIVCHKYIKEIILCFV